MVKNCAVGDSINCRCGPKVMDFFSRPDVRSQTSTCIYSLPIPFFIFNFFEKCSNQFYSDIFHL